MLQTTTDLHSPIYQDALDIRRVVFIEEQNVPEDLEIDEHEDDCSHLVWYENGKALGTLRLLDYGNGICKVQRVAVLKEARGKGVGAILMQAAEAMARERGYQSLLLGAQNHAMPFYEKLGFGVCSEEYVDAGILHHDMAKAL